MLAYTYIEKGKFGLTEKPETENYGCTGCDRACDPG